MSKLVYRLRRIPLVLAGLAVALGLVTVPVVVANHYRRNAGRLTIVLLVVAVAALGLGGLAGRLGSPFPRRTVLELDLTRPLQEHAPDNPLAKATGGRGPTVREVVEALERAAGHKRVVALYARVGTGIVGLAQLEEIRDAVLAFRRSGKPAVAFAETFGELGPGTGSYFLATAFDEIALQPSGDIGVTGVWGQTFFLRGTLDKLGVVPRLDQRYEYKNAMNQLTERAFTPPHREAVERVLESQFDRIVRAIADHRGLAPDAVRAVVDRAPILGTEAVGAGLVDRLAYRDEVVDSILAAAGRGAALVSFTRFAKKTARSRRGGATVALVYGVGAVVRGKSGFDPQAMGPTMGSDTVAGAIRSARKDKRVKAILFRVDSPGGSYVASDTIWRETVRAKEAGKPVIVSMGNVAGSGGYFVAMAADKIVAQPGTITGSIGVLGGKQVAAGLFDKLGLSFDAVQIGANADMFTSTRDYSAQGWQRLQGFLDRVYEDFTGKVATGRQMDRAAVHEVARGRIWTGADAQARGLVDELGGFPVALRLAREAAGLAPDARLRLKVYPKRRSPLAQVRGETEEGVAGRRRAGRARGRRLVGLSHRRR